MCVHRPSSSLYRLAVGNGPHHRVVVVSMVVPPAVAGDDRNGGWNVTSYGPSSSRGATAVTMAEMRGQKSGSKYLLIDV